MFTNQREYAQHMVWILVAVQYDDSRMSGSLIGWWLAMEQAVLDCSLLTWHSMHGAAHK
jgi:hypothetical protein